MAADVASLARSARDKASVAAFLYAYGKVLVARGDLAMAARQFANARDLVRGREWYRLRVEAIRKAISEVLERHVRSSSGAPLHVRGAAEVRRWDVICFANEVAGHLNYSISCLSDTPLLDYVAEHRLLRPVRAELPHRRQLDDFYPVGVYRWAGDAQRFDEYSGWIRRMKGGDENTARHLGRLLAEGLRARTDFLTRADFLVPVPPDPRRGASRGFNPPGILAAVAGGVLGVPVIENALKKQQALRSRELSPWQVRQNYVPRESVRRLIHGSSVILIDDVAARGATLAACALRLRELGAEHVDCTVVGQSISSYQDACLVDDG
ncbi:MAG: hypothetical protein ABIO70_14670 [Pseudomonadota bacterium]